VRGVSFAFTQMRDSWHLDGGHRIRTVQEVMGLRDVSPTHRPAYPDTTLAIRSLEIWESEMIKADDLDIRRRLGRLAELSALALKRWLEPFSGEKRFQPST
jgi:phage head maturation protease